LIYIWSHVNVNKEKRKIFEFLESIGTLENKNFYNNIGHLFLGFVILNVSNAGWSITIGIFDLRFPIFSPLLQFNLIFPLFQIHQTNPFIISISS
jgi:hypothetical protein